MDSESIYYRSTEGGFAMPESTVVLQARARYASMARYRPDGHPERVAASRDYAEVLLAQHIRTTLAKFPPLTNEQRDRLTALLAPERAA